MENNNVKLERKLNREKVARRNDEGLTPKQKEKKDRQKIILSLYEQGLSQIEIANKLGITKFMVSRDIKYLKENNLL